jgi:carotenoid cleavage dioxygenase-like enzyme
VVELERPVYDQYEPVPDMFTTVGPGGPVRYVGGEPAFAGDPSGPGGAMICQQFDTTKGESSFLIFDAFAVAAGPRAVVRLDSPVHLGFHACWVEAR